MDVGQLNKRLEIYRWTQVKDGFGQYNNTKELAYTVWCNIKQSRSVISEDNVNLSNELTLDLTVRKRTGDKAQINDTFSFRNKDYKINEIREIDLDYWTELKCTTVE